MTSKNFEVCYCLKDSPKTNNDLHGMITTEEDRDELYKECLAAPQGGGVRFMVTFFWYCTIILVAPHCATRFSLSAQAATEPWLKISSRIRRHRRYIVNCVLEMEWNEGNWKRRLPERGGKNSTVEEINEVGDDDNDDVRVVKK
ncbi:uncharacterized protein G2W53_022335 [Senna tora]|uniref:Uncharacterized protein n=1 Tax=Senna tora TaxID=362788 RepID=A0A834TNH6_9FABA|nr:uncharacterized protein G2W53_022335 [Senna tora]